jgi:hypothetical protein
MLYIYSYICEKVLMQLFLLVVALIFTEIPEVLSYRYLKTKRYN